jgi:hypothetical protein
MSVQPQFLELSDRLLDFIEGSPDDPSLGERMFTELALELFALQYRHVPVYQRFCQARGAVPERISDWRAIPAISTRAFKEYEISSLPPEQRTQMFVSSGTTREQRSRHYHGKESLRIYEASLSPWFERHLLAGESQAFSVLVLTPSGMEAPHSSLVHMFETVRRRSKLRDFTFLGHVTEDGNGAWNLDLEETERRLRDNIAQDRPVLLLGTAFSFVHLLDYLGDRGARLPLPTGSRALETGGYKGRSRTLERGQLHALIAERLGISADFLVSEYGMSELSSQAFDHVAGQSTAEEGTLAPGRAFRFPPWARVQIVSPETGVEVHDGECGLVQVLDLANVYSVMSVQTEDLAMRDGSGFVLRGRAAESEPRGCSLMTR